MKKVETPPPSQSIKGGFTSQTEWEEWMQRRDPVWVQLLSDRLRAALSQVGALTKHP